MAVPLTERERVYRRPKISMETCGGMAPDAETLLHIVADAGEEQLGLWPKAAVLKQLTGAVSIDLSLYSEEVVVNSFTDMALCWPAVCGTSDGGTRRERV